MLHTLDLSTQIPLPYCFFSSLFTACQTFSLMQCEGIYFRTGGEYDELALGSYHTVIGIVIPLIEIVAEGLYGNDFSVHCIYIRDFFISSCSSTTTDSNSLKWAQQRFRIDQHKVGKNNFSCVISTILRYILSHHNLYG